MSFNTRFETLNTIRSYAQGVEVYERTKPFATPEPEMPDARPLGARAQKLFKIRRAQGEVQLILYSSPVVRILEDDTMLVSTCGWDTQMTAKFINAATPLRVSLVNYKMTLSTSDGYHRLSGVYASPTQIKHGVVLNPERLTYWKINRKKSNAVRKPYQPFLHFVRGYFGLMADDDGFVYVESTDFQRGMSTDEFVRSIRTAPPELYAQYLCGVLGRGRYTLPEATHALNGLINRAHSTEILEEVELPIGSLPKPNPYGDWRKP